MIYRQLYEKNQRIAIVKRIIRQNLPTGIRACTWKAGTKFLSDKEIEAISKLTGKNEEQVRSDFEAKGAHIVDLYDDEGQIRSYEDVVL